MSETAQILPVDAGMLTFYKALSAESPPESAHWPLPEQRAAWDAVCAKFRAPMPVGIHVEDRVLNGVPCQIFRPEGGGPRPGLIYFHGGGWVLGGPGTHGDICAEMAADSGCVSVLVDYRRAPEHIHPAQLEDCLTVLAWLRANGREIGIDPDHIIGAGDSAGGQMTAALAMSLRDQGLTQLSAMALIYPVLGADIDTPSYLRNANAPCLTRDEMRFYLGSFLGPRGNPNWRDPFAVPNLAKNVSGLPPACITVAAHDPLHDDGVIFHEKLLAAGIASTLRREPALAHSYMRARHHSTAAMAGFQAIISALNCFKQT